MYKIFTEKRFLMKLSFIYVFLLISGFQLLSASNSRAQGLEDIMVTIDVNQNSLEVLLKNIEIQTDLTFAYLPAEVNRYHSISINTGRQSVKSALDRALETTDLRYRYIENSIILFPKAGEKKKSSYGQQDTGSNSHVIPYDNIYIDRQDKVIDNLSSKDLVEIYNKRLVLNVTGQITDINGEPLIGVNILVKGTNKGTTTDLDGRFSLNDIDDQAVLVVSYIGYKSQEVSVDGQTSLTISMQEDVQTLDEVIVVGYGTVKKSDLTGSVQRVNGDDFKKQPITQLTEMLSGTVPGFYSKQSASSAGGGSMEIRGRNSLSAQSDPMIVLDGVIFNGSLREINPSDIESIDILKDASSAAIFGARAAAGVILITTKKGGKGKPRINFSTKLGISQPTKDRKPFGGDRFLQFREDYLREQSFNNSTVPKYFYTNPNNLPSSISIDEWLAYGDNPNPDSYTEYLQRLNLYPTEQKNALAGNEIDYYPLVMNSGFRQNYDINVGGGTENIKYYWSMGYQDNEGVIVGDEYSVLQTRLNVDFKLNDWLSIGTNTQYSVRNEDAVPASLSSMYIASPFGELYNEDGSLNLRPHDDPGSFNPLMNYLGQDRYRKVNSIFSILYTKIKLPFEIEYKLSYQPRISFTNEYNFWGDQTITGTQTYPGGYATRVNSRVSEWMVDNLLTWNKQIGIQNIDLTFLYNIEKYQGWYDLQSNQSFSPNQNLGFNGLQFGTSPTLNNSDTKETGDALMGRINYSLLDKYLFTASVRRDGYSAFGQDQPHAIFPALAFAWKLSDENFYNQESFINRMKFRVSWGINGNRSIGAYSALARLSSTLDYDGSQLVVGVQNASLANPNLVWEKTTALNFGLDLGLWENRIDISADYYVGKTNDLLMNRLLPIITGFSSVTTNLGELKNQGFELSVGSVNISEEKFSWNINLVFSLNRNELVSLFGDVGDYELLGESESGELPDFSNKWFPGYGVDAVWDYNITGIWQIDEADKASEYNMSPGDYKSEDVNDDGKFIDVEDKQFIGYTQPRYNIGLGNSFNMGAFSLSIFLRADLGHLIPFNEVKRGSLSHDRRNYNLAPAPYWTPENRNNTYPRLRPIHTAYGGGLGVYEPGSFLRVQDIALSYNLPGHFYEKLNMKNIEVYLSGRNIFTVDNFVGWDPESGMTPMPKTVSFGIDITI